MNTKQILIIGVSLLMISLISVYGIALVRQKQKPEPLVRLAELEIDPAQLETYKAFLKEEIETSIRVEKGVLNLYAVAEKENPSHIRIFEIYADEQAYRTHLETPHFKKYKTATQQMVKALKLVETTPILLGAKAR